MCFCNPNNKTPFCNSFECKKECDSLKEKSDKEVKNKLVHLKAKMQLIWKWAETVNRATGIEPPEEFFKWFDDAGVPL